MPDTIFALSSGQPPAAVAIIRISGADAHAGASKIAGELPPARQAAVRILRDPLSSEHLDDALILRFDGPGSATGEDLVELHCHGGRAVVAAVLASLGAIEGFRQASPGEFTRRAFANGRIDLMEAEGLADLLEAETESQRKAALALAQGGLSKQIAEWQRRVLELSAIAERAIDYDEDDNPMDPLLSEGSALLVSEMSDWLERPRVEPLKDGVRVVVAGPPNAGKSSLINVIAGYERAIVTDIPGTTRDHIDVPISIGGVAVILTDTAGLRETQDAVEAIGVERAGGLVRSADVVVWLGAIGDAPEHPRLIKVHPKADLDPAPPAGLLAVSSKSGEGVTELLQQIVSLSKTLLPTEGAVALNRRQADLLNGARLSLASASTSTDAILVAEELRQARFAFDQLTGRAGLEDVLDALFGRFCLGK